MAVARSGSHSFHKTIMFTLFVLDICISQKHCGPVIKSLRQPPDLPEDYSKEYSSLGPLLCQHVIKLREQEAHKSRLLASAGLGRPAVVSQIR